MQSPLKPIAQMQIKATEEAKVTMAKGNSKAAITLPMDARRALLCLVACVGLFIAALGASRADAADLSPEVTAFSLGVSSLQAGAHADATTSFRFATTTEESSAGTSVKGGAPKNVLVTLPKGMVADVTGIPQCTSGQFGSGSGSWGGCPVTTQVGTVTLVLNIAGTVYDGTVLPLPTLANVPVFNMVPARGQVAKFGFAVLGFGLSFASAQLQNGEYRINVGTENANDGFPVVGADLTLWGVPGAEAHDGLRMCQDEISLGCGSPESPRPFMTNSGECGVDGVATLNMNTYQHPDVWASKTSPPTILEGCDKQPFAPTIGVNADPPAAASPVGLDVNLKLPQTFDNPEGLSTPPLRRVAMTLPQGFSISPSAAQGLDACSDAQLGVGTDGPVACPPGSRIGEVTVHTPLLGEDLSGGVFLGTQLSDDPASGDMYRMAIEVANAERGVWVKLPGKIKADPANGRITTIFDENPQLPFETLHLQLKTGPRAPLSTPTGCGTSSVEAELLAWSGQVAHVFAPLTINQNCNQDTQFAPGLEAGTTNPVGGKYSPFTLRVTRPDGQPNISAIEAKLPEGLTAKLAGVPLCADAAAASGNCPAASQVGTTTVGAGVGSSPIYIPQPGKAPTAVYLAGPYKGASYSMVVKVPAQAGPFDLGTVTVRNSLQVNPETAQVTAKSDPLPQILAGVPIAYRDIRVDVNRPDFTLNPTSCESMSVGSTITSAQGATATPSSRFQAADCASLGFAPKLTLSVKGGHKRGAYQRLKAVLTQPQGQANIGRVSVALPHSEFLAQEHIKTICTRVQFAADQCPAGSIYGQAKAWTPLLDQPLQGPVYLRSSNNPLPDLVAALHGAIDIDLAGRIDSVNGGIRNTFETVPDAPVSRFVLEMKGGKKSLLVNSRNICKSTSKATVKMDGQNGKVHDFNPVLGTNCGKGKKGR